MSEQLVIPAPELVGDFRDGLGVTHVLADLIEGDFVATRIRVQAEGTCGDGGLVYIAGVNESVNAGLGTGAFDVTADTNDGEYPVAASQALFLVNHGGVEQRFSLVVTGGDGTPLPSAGFENNDNPVPAWVSVGISGSGSPSDVCASATITVDYVPDPFADGDVKDDTPAEDLVAWLTERPEWAWRTNPQKALAYASTLSAGTDAYWDEVYAGLLAALTATEGDSGSGS